MTAMQTAESNSILRNRRRFRSHALATAGAAALGLMVPGLIAPAAMAQQTAATQVADDSTVEQITVTGTRVQRDGYNAPTPVTVLGTEDIQHSSPSNLADYVNQIPAIAGSSTASNSQGSVSSGTSGINTLNLRDLGTNRTLVLLDGHRQPTSSSSGQVDINTIPQQLVQRVDIVTGGASADYGSDAVGGVVNFVLDKNYTGLKGNVEYGQTTDDLQPTYKVNATYGLSLLGDKAHILISGEWDQQAAIHNYVPKWENSGFYTIQNPAYTATNGKPYYLVGPGVGPSENTPGGLVISGPLNGTTFGINGTVGQISYGTISGPWMIGGDTALTYQNYLGTESLAAGEVRESLYTHDSYQLTPEIEVYVEGYVNRYKGDSIYLQPIQVGGITIQADNAFLPASIKTAMTANKLTSLTMGSTNTGFPEAGDRNGREVQHVAAGADGVLNTFGADWKWDVYASIGQTTDREQERLTWNTSRLTLASDAILAPAGNAAGIAAGTIVCRSTLTSPSNGCMPISRIGPNGGTQSPAAYQAAINYIFDKPYRQERLSEQDYSFNVSSNPFEDWQGPVSVAFGGEWRLESINGFVPTQYQSGWNFGNYLVNHGHYSVAEGYVEAVVPLLPGLDANGAMRYTAYSTSGGVSTWKAGLTYAPPFLPDIKLRATYSHDIRAPTLADLYAAGTATSNAVLINNVSYPITYQTTGNLNLIPENANTAGVGVIFTPTFIDGLTVSVDYYNITVKNAISTLAVQAATDLCFKNAVQSFCNNIVYANGVTATPTNYGAQLKSLILQPFNFASQKAQGVDFDVTYDVPLDSLDMVGKIPGALRLNALATNYIQNTTNSGVSPPTNAAGVNISGGVPSWLYRISATYTNDPWTFFVVGRGISAGVYANEYTQCASACPAVSAPYYSINNNHIPGTFYVDATATYSFQIYNLDSAVFASVKNVFDTAPVLVGNGPASVSTPARPQTNWGLYDYLGRIVRVGLRFNT